MRFIVKSAGKSLKRVRLTLVSGHLLLEARLETAQRTYFSRSGFI